MKRRYLTADDGGRIPVHVSGEGPALVILHGWTGHYQDFRGLVADLNPYFTCYGWEARPYHAADPVMSRMGRDVQNLFDEFALERPLLMGHSMGALTCWEYLRQFGDGQLRGLCLIDQSPMIRVTDDWPLGLWGNHTLEANERFRARLEQDFAAAVVDLISRSRLTPDGKPAIPAEFLEPKRARLARMQPQPWIEAWQSFWGNDYRDVLPTIKVPTFLAYGGKGAYYGPKVADYVHRHIGGSQMVLYPDAGHAPQVEAQADFVKDFLGFCRRHTLLG